MPFLHEVLLSIRPASLGSWLSGVLRVNKRRVVSVADGKFWVNPVSNFGYRISSTGHYEPDTRRAIENNLKPNNVFIDLGANEGYFSVVASRIIGSSGRIIAIEPQARLQEVIRRNCELNNLKNVTLVQSVVSSFDGTVELALTPDMNTGASGLYRRTRYPLPTQSAPCLTLSSLFRTHRITHCDLMKMDIEGAEYDLVMQAGDLLSSGAIKCIVMEVHDSIISSRTLQVEELYKRMDTYGYTCLREGELSIFKFRDYHEFDADSAGQGS